MVRHRSKAIRSNPSRALLRGREEIGKWLEMWDVRPHPEYQLVVNTRLRTALGRCRPSAGIIELRPDLLGWSARAFLEVLCHEAAHIAVFHRSESGARPHGPEWRALVLAAGFEPRAERVSQCRVDRTEDAAPGGRKRRFPTTPFDHICPVCQMVRTARRPVRKWRCAECVRAGLDGELRISKRATSRGEA